MISPAIDEFFCSPLNGDDNFWDMELKGCPTTAWYEDLGFAVYKGEVAHAPPEVTERTGNKFYSWYDEWRVESDDLLDINVYDSMSRTPPLSPPVSHKWIDNCFTDEEEEKENVVVKELEDTNNRLVYRTLLENSPPPVQQQMVGDDLFMLCDNIAFSEDGHEKVKIQFSPGIKKIVNLLSSYYLDQRIIDRLLGVLIAVDGLKESEYEDCRCGPLSASSMLEHQAWKKQKHRLCSKWGIRVIGADYVYAKKYDPLMALSQPALWMGQSAFTLNLRYKRGMNYRIQCLLAVLNRVVERSNDKTVLNIAIYWEHERVRDKRYCGRGLYSWVGSLTRVPTHVGSDANPSPCMIRRRTQETLEEDDADSMTYSLPIKKCDVKFIE